MKTKSAKLSNNLLQMKVIVKLILYCIFEKNNPVINHKAILPGLLVGK